LLAASVAALLEDNYTLQAAKARSRSRDGSSVGDALIRHMPSRAFIRVQIGCHTLIRIQVGS
jgi:hypothetical protein